MENIQSLQERSIELLQKIDFTYSHLTEELEDISEDINLLKNEFTQTISQVQQLINIAVKRMNL